MNRRNWLIKSGLALTGIGVLPLQGFAVAPEPANEPTGDGAVILCCNENPYGPSPAARKAMADMVNSSNRYQWDMIKQLMTAIAVKDNVKAENVLMGAGSTELLDLLVQWTVMKKGSVVVADPSFTRWADIAEKAGIKQIAVPLTANKRYNLPAMLKAIQPDTRMVYICNPNNPTGTICDHKELLSFVEQATKKTLVVIDEAYIEFAGEESLAPVTATNKNLVVIKTLSKIYGMAGARAGYAIGHIETIDQLGNLRVGGNMGIAAATLAGAIAALNDAEFVRSTKQLNEQARKFTITELEKLNIPCIPSSTNFIYFSLASYKKDFFEILKNNNIKGTAIMEEEGKWSRITVGTIKEMEQFIAAIK